MRLRIYLDPVRHARISAELATIGAERPQRRSRTVTVKIELDISEARKVAKDVCEGAAARSFIVHKVVTIVSELARNIVLYAGTGEGYFNGDAVRGNGIYKTTDGGTTWTQLASTNNNSDNWTNNGRFSKESRESQACKCQRIIKHKLSRINNKRLNRKVNNAKHCAGKYPNFWSSPKCQPKNRHHSKIN